MNTLWWQLPGPNRFVSRIIQDLRDGKNVILCLPEYSPSGLASAVRSTLGDSGDWSWNALRACDEDQTDPAHLLFSRFVPDMSPNTIWNAHTLSKEESFAGKIIWLDNLTPSTWSAWKEFITDYEPVCRSRSLLDRTLFCVPLIGELALDPPKEDVCLAHHYWRDAVDRLDMLLFTSSIFQEKRMPDLQKRVAISIIANIALWDPAVGERLVHEDLEKILSPVPILQEVARERGWYPEDTNSDSWSWHRGMKDRIDGEEKIHSAVLAFNDVDSEIERRIWSAEIGVVLPFIEERRQEILGRLAGLLKVPFKTRFGEVISDLRDLEIGHIESQVIHNGVAVNPKIRRLIHRLREIRNCLSHLEPLSPELLLCEEINSFVETLRRS